MFPGWGWQAAFRAGRLAAAGTATSRSSCWPTSSWCGRHCSSQKRSGLTVSQTCLLVDVLPRTGSPADCAIAIVDYRRARNAAARRAHVQHRRRYCVYLFRQYEHYWVRQAFKSANRMFDGRYPMNQTAPANWPGLFRLDPSPQRVQVKWSWLHGLGATIAIGTWAGAPQGLGDVQLHQYGLCPSAHCC